MSTSIPTATLLRQAGDAMLGRYRHAPGFEARMTCDTGLIASGEPHPLLNGITVSEPGPVAEVALRDHVTSIRAWTAGAPFSSRRMPPAR